MSHAEKDTLTCSHCEENVREDDEFCPHCGSLFIDDVKCSEHPRIDAGGVCIVCALPYCGDCGGSVNGLFLCNEHAGYEIYQGMARVYGTSDEAMIRYASTCLEQAGLHPFIYQRKASPISIGGPGYSLFRASGEFDGHIINELKLMVPCQEVSEAEKVIRELKIEE